jgi:alkylation response protein AidB-like acyl-CoA dehydrogenase
MDLNLSSDHQMLSNSLRRFLEDNYAIEHRNKTAFTAPYHCPETWTKLAELGVIGAFVGEADGGFGGSAEDVMVVFEEIGRGLCAEPMLGTLLAASLLKAVGDKDSLASLISGEKRGTVAVLEPDVSVDLTAISTAATGGGGKWKLSGRKSSIYGGPGCDILLVAARTDKGVGLFRAAPDGLIGAATSDGGGTGELILEDLVADCLTEDASEALEDTLDLGRIALCAEAVGAMERLNEMTIDYLLQRKQFGQPLAAFQALQHRAVDMVADAQMAKSITIRAVTSFGKPDQARHVAMAKNLIGRTATATAEEAIQLHGGIGMTWEYAASHFAKRLVMIDHQLGDRRDHALRLVAMAKQAA